MALAVTAVARAAKAAKLQVVAANDVVATRARASDKVPNLGVPKRSGPRTKLCDYLLSIALRLVGKLPED